MLSLIFFILAAICNAIMDTTQFHYDTSIFTKLNRQFWDGARSWRNKYKNGSPTYGRKKWVLGLNYPVVFTDAFHLFKSLMIVFICESIVTFDCTWAFIHPQWWSYLLMIGVYGFLWNSIFNIMYNHVLRK